MKKHLTFLTLFCLTFNLSVFSQNALDFDGIDDVVLVPNASSLITSGVGISFGLWVYPRNSTPSFPNFDSFGGFRNNSDADFYIIQIGANTLEARFRNSSGINFDISFGGLLLNTWQHFAFTYDGSMLKLYQNGIEVGSQAANGNISNAFESLYIGDGFYFGGNYFLDGKVDEVVLFNKALSQPEIECLTHGDVDTSSAELMLYYGFNQGAAGANNAGIATLNGLSSQASGTLSNFTLDGNSSNWVQGDIFAATEIASICAGESYTYNGTAYSNPGTYSFYFPLTNGCDSVSHFVLNALTVDTSLIASNTILTATGIATTHQWVQCDNNYAIIPGATQSNFTVSANGDYACIITNGNCVDTSRCVTVIVTGLDNYSEVSQLSVWPVPANNILTISGLTGLYHNIEIYDETGRLMIERFVSVNKDIITINIVSLESGIYYLRSLDSKGNQSISKFVVMRQ
jgi:hypothetical protein